MALQPYRVSARAGAAPLSPLAASLDRLSRTIAHNAPDTHHTPHGLFKHARHAPHNAPHHHTKHDTAQTQRSRDPLENASRALTSLRSAPSLNSRRSPRS